MAGRRCPGPQCPTILTQGERYCPRHARDYEQRRGSSTQRGYDSAHRRLRAAWQALIDRGEVVHCARCGALITGTSWQLGHDDNDRTKYNGPECASCNASAGGAQGHARQG